MIGPHFCGFPGGPPGKPEKLGKIGVFDPFLTPRTWGISRKNPDFWPKKAKKVQKTPFFGGFLGPKTMLFGGYNPPIAPAYKAEIGSFFTNFLPKNGVFLYIFLQKSRSPLTFDEKSSKTACI